MLGFVLVVCISSRPCAAGESSLRPADGAVVVNEDFGPGHLELQDCGPHGIVVAEGSPASSCDCDFGWWGGRCERRETLSRPVRVAFSFLLYGEKFWTHRPPLRASLVGTARTMLKAHSYPGDRATRSKRQDASEYEYEYAVVVFHDEACNATQLRTKLDRRVRIFFHFQGHTMPYT